MGEEEQRRRILTKLADVPEQLLRTLANDGGTEGIRLLLKEDKWDGTTPIATITHMQGATGSIAGSKWMTWVRC